MRYKFLLISFIIALSLVGLVRLYYFLTDDFRLANISYDMKNGPIWKTFPLTEQDKNNVFSILGQKFYYIGKGAQSYAFESEDQNYVLKFFKFKHLKPNFLLNLLPPIPLFERYKTAVRERKTRKIHGIFLGYQIAYEENKEGSKLIYLHLMPTDFFNKQVTVVDKIGIERRIDLDHTVFLIQRKGEMLRTRIHRLFADNRIESVNKVLSDILEMYIKEYRLGVYDHDHGIMNNTGFIGNEPFHLDVGKLSKDDSMKHVDQYKLDLKQVVWKMNDWIYRYYPEHYSVVSPYLFERYFQLTGDVFDINNSAPPKFRKKK